MGGAERIDGIVQAAGEHAVSADRSVHSGGSTRVSVALDERVATILLDRPPLNVMNIAMMDGLHRAITRAAEKSDILIFRGEGKAFSAGAEIADHVPERVGDMLRAFHRVFVELSRGKAVTIAAVHGHCLGGGCELATFCDFVVAAESAAFGQPEIKLGCFPPVAMVTLPRMVGMRAAMDLILSGRTLSALEAQRMGLVTRVVPDKELDHAVASLVADLRALSPTVLAMARRALWSADGFDFERALKAVEEFYLNELMKTNDANEGIRAFLEKRRPVWQSA